MTRDFGNPHSTAHVYGTTQHKVCEEARGEVASVIEAQPEEIIFMSGATEANNTALKGISRALKSKRNEIITFSTEHKCILESWNDLSKEGICTKVLPVDKNGLVNVQLLKDEISDKTLLVSAMAVNNEIGVVQDLKTIGEICKEHGAYFHTDAAQGIGKTKINVDEMHIDMLSKEVILMFRSYWT
jgi:cysteine desulfurase